MRGGSVKRRRAGALSALDTPGLSRHNTQNPPRRFARGPAQDPQEHCVTLSRSIAIAICLACATAALALAPLRWDFEAGESAHEDWVASALDAGTRGVQASSARASSGARSLAITGSLPQSFGVTYLPWDDWTGYTQLSFDLYIPAGVPKEFDLWVYLKDKQYYWYQTAPFRSPTTGKPLPGPKPGKWTTIKLDISPTSTIWKPGGHRRAWERALYYPREFGLRVFSRRKWSGTVWLDNVQLTGEKLPLGRYAAGQPRPVPYKLAVTPSAASVPQFRKLELGFSLKRDYDNPYDPRVVDVQGHFTGPDGQTIHVPGFIYQAYERTQTPEGYEKLIPVGHTSWKVRFAPRLQGKYTYTVTVRDALGETRSDPGSFVATAPVDPRGYVRISKQDPRCFEYDNGEYLFPTGINMRDGGDQAEQQKGSYDFDAYFKLFREHGLNFVRTWMCAWWGGIEWSDKYHSRFDGVGRYAQYNAWRLDYAFDLAEKTGLLLELTLNSHGQMRRDKFDAEWEYNPYSVRNGGFVASPAMFFTSPRAKEMVKQRYRYIVARWGYSQNLMSWDMVNEVDLTEGYQRDKVAAWHQEMAAYLKSIDPWKHLVATHICLYGYGQELFALPEIEYVQADAYWKRRDIGMYEGWRSRQQFDKPFLFIEYGPQTVSLPISYERWQLDFRLGMWVSNMIPGAAPGQFWYHDAWREHRLWEYQQGLIAFNAGEDRRGQNYQTLRATIEAPGIPEWRPTPEERQRGEKGPIINARAMGNGTRGMFYLYQFDNMSVPKPETIPDARRVHDATVTLYGFNPGRYRVEYWDTIAGKVVGTQEVAADGNGLVLKPPTFAEDLAGKVRPL